MKKISKATILVGVLSVCLASIYAYTREKRIDGNFMQAPERGNPPEGWNPQEGGNPQENFNHFGKNKNGMTEQSKDTPDYSIQNVTGFIEKDLYSNFKEDFIINISFSGEGAEIKTVSESKTISNNQKEIILSKNQTALDNDIKITKVVASKADSEAAGITIEYKGKKNLKYVLSGKLNGTLLVKNKSADCAIVMNDLNIEGTENGPALRLTSETSRTFIVIPEGTSNVITDNRKKSSDLFDDKKGSIYAKGALIITGVNDKSDSVGTLTVNNTGYKHAVYSKDYIRIANVNLNVNSDGRDCLRAMNSIIVDSGNINLVGNGTVLDEESAGIKVEGEDADEDELTVTYNKGAGFIIINDGTINIKTVGKGITAHWKSDETMIGNASYTEKDCGKSLLYEGAFIDKTLTEPNPFVTINGGTINITTTGTPSDYCSPEGIEAKNNLLINGGKITVNTTDDGLNAGGGICINDGEIFVTSTLNDAMDANGKRGIEINGGTVIAIATANPAECGFDCDNNRFVITGGLVLGMGSSNYSSPTASECTQNVLVISADEAPAGSSFAILDSKKKPVFAYSVPNLNTMGYNVMIVSSPSLGTSESNFTVTKDIKTIKGTEINNTGLYKDIKSVSGGKNSTSLTTTTRVTSVGNINNGFMRGFGGGRGDDRDGSRPNFRNQRGLENPPFGR